ncbi:MAG: peptidyl-prolyl cis-trans isomerase [Cellulosilyticum sp.]|nr:peptidyl-prolyl cis-trans isomerase [Cellulosilyticum sp.]
MKLFKKVVAVVAIATMSLTMVACGSSKAATEMTSEDEKGLIIARVEGEPIYKTMLDNEMMQMEYYMQLYYGEDYKSNPEVMEQYDAYKKDVVESLIEAEILVHKAKEMKSIKVDEKEIEEQLEATKASFPTEEEFNKGLEESGMTLEDLKENIEKNLLVTKLISEYTENKVEVKDEEIETYYNENIANYTTKPGANIYHILVDSEEKANEVLDKYNAGTSFADLAAEYGTDGTATQGGALGFIEYDTTSYDQDFMAGAKELGEGEISQPVKTQFGWHLIKVDGVQKEEVVQPLEEVKETIEATLRSSKAETLLMEDLEKWKEDVNVVRFEENYKTEVVEAETTEDTTSETTEETNTENTDSGDTQETTPTATATPAQ